MTALRVSMPQSVPRPVDYGHKVLVQRGSDDVGAFGVDGQGRAEVAADDALDPVLLLGLEVGGAGGQDVAEKVALGDAAYVLLVFVEHGYGRVAVVGEALEPWRMVSFSCRKAV